MPIEFVMMENERRKERRALKKSLKTTGRPKVPVSKKYRICIRCGHAIQKRTLYYNGSVIGQAYIHVFLGWRSAEAFQREGLENEHVAVPRPIPSP